MREDLKAMVRRHFEEIWPNGDVAALTAITHPGFVNHEAPPGVPSDREGTTQAMLMLRRAFSDQRYEIHLMIAEDDTVAACLTHSGRHTGEFLGLPPTNRRFAYRHVHIVRFAEGKAIEHWAVRDDATLLRQLTGELTALQPATTG
jgi:predicted ester cyclase